MAPEVSFDQDNILATVKSLSGDRPPDVTEDDWFAVVELAKAVVPALHVDAANGKRRAAVARLCASAEGEIKADPALAPAAEKWESDAGLALRREMRLRLEMQLSLGTHPLFGTYLLYIMDHDGRVEASVPRFPQGLQSIAGIVNKVALAFAEDFDQDEERKRFGYAKVAEFLQAQIKAKQGRDVKVEFQNLKFNKRRGAEAHKDEVGGEPWNDILRGLEGTEDPTKAGRWQLVEAMRSRLDRLTEAEGSLRVIVDGLDQQKLDVERRKESLERSVSPWYRMRGDIVRAYEGIREALAAAARLQDPDLNVKTFVLGGDQARARDAALAQHDSEAPAEVAELAQVRTELNAVSVKRNAAGGVLAKVADAVRKGKMDLVATLDTFGAIDPKSFVVAQEDDLVGLDGERVCLKLDINRDQNWFLRLGASSVARLPDGTMLEFTVSRKPHQAFYTLDLDQGLGSLPAASVMRDDRRLLKMRPGREGAVAGEAVDKIMKGRSEFGGDDQVYAMAVCLAAEADTPSPRYLHVFEIAELAGIGDVDPRDLAQKVPGLRRGLYQLGYGVDLLDVDCPIAMSPSGQIKGLRLVKNGTGEA